MNSILTFILIFFVTLEASAGNTEPTMLNEQSEHENEFPYQAFVIIDGKYAGGAVLITKLHLLTAANCVEDVVRRRPTEAYVEIKLGALEIFECDTYAVLRISIHPDFEMDTERYHHINDIAVIHLVYQVNVSSVVRPISLPMQSTKFPLHNSLGLISGYFNVKSNRSPSSIRSTAIVKTQKTSACQKLLYPDYILSVTQICAISQLDTEYQESHRGNPLVDTDKSVLYGILSTFRCIHAKNRKITFFSKVSLYIGYIQEEIRYYADWDKLENPPPAVNFAWTTLQLLKST